MHMIPGMETLEKRQLAYVDFVQDEASRWLREADAHGQRSADQLAWRLQLLLRDLSAILAMTENDI